MVMHKRALYKDPLREIRHTMGRFLSIMCIAALGTSFYAGIQSTAPDLRKTGDVYLDETNTMDIQLLSTVGFEQEDLDAIQQTDGVLAISPTHSIDVLADMGEENVVMKVMALPQSYQGQTPMNQIVLVEGRMPENDNECVLEDAHFPEIQLGDTIPLTSGTDDPLSDSLHADEVTVVGRVQSPLYMALQRGTSTLGSGTVHGYMLVPDALFNLEVYTNVYVTVEGAREMDPFTAEYDALIDPLVDTLEALGESRSETWYAQTVQEANDALAEQQQAYDDAVKEANRQFDSAQRQIDDGLAQIVSGRQALDDAQAELDAQRQAAQAQLAQAEQQLQQGEAAYAQAQAEYEAIASQLPPEQAEQLRAQLEEQRQTLEASRAQFEAQKAQTESRLAAGQAQIDQTRSTLQDSEQELSDAQKTLDQSKRDAQAEFDEAEQQLQDARAEIADIPHPQWYVLDLDMNEGFVEYTQTADRMEAIGRVFPAFFFLIAALVCLTTMTRMVDEQRGNMGTLKALGYHRRDIAMKYLLYALSASVVGGVVGVLIGLQLFPRVIFNAYGILFSMPGPVIIFHTANAVISIVLAVGVTVLATLAACYSQLHDTPATLMRPFAPKAGKLILLERIGWLWKRLNFSSKVTARNLFRYKKRLFMTLIGVAGSTALLLTGYGIKDSINILTDLQYGNLYHYQVSVGTESDLAQEEFDAVQQQVQACDGVEQAVPLYSKSMDFTKEGEERVQSATLSIFADDETLSSIITLRTRRGHDPIELQQQGAVITEKLAKQLDVEVGDTIVLRDGTQRIPFTVTGITEHYLMHYVYVSQSAYEQAAGTLPADNALYLVTNGQVDEETLCNEVLQVENITQVTPVSETAKMLDRTISSMDSVIWVLIVSAGALAFVVMYNLTNINIGERTREIATLKVLGFTRREVAAYVFRENVLLTLLGILVGFVLGIGLHRFVMATVEVDMMMFGREIKAASYLIASAMTFAFAMLVNLAMLPKLKKIDMVESLKTVE